jgi:hypothetical protein
MPSASKLFGTPNRIPAGIMEEERVIETHKKDFTTKFKVGPAKSATQLFSAPISEIAKARRFIQDSVANKPTYEQSDFALSRVIDKGFDRVMNMMEPGVVGEILSAANPAAKGLYTAMKYLAIPYEAGLGALEQSLVEIGLAKEDAEEITTSTEIVSLIGGLGSFVPRSKKLAEKLFSEGINNLIDGVDLKSVPTETLTNMIRVVKGYREKGIKSKDFDEVILEFSKYVKGRDKTDDVAETVSDRVEDAQSKMVSSTMPRQHKLLDEEDALIHGKNPSEVSFNESVPASMIEVDPLVQAIDAFAQGNNIDNLLNKEMVAAGRKIMEDAGIKYDPSRPFYKQISEVLSSDRIIPGRIQKIVEEHGITIEEFRNEYTKVFQIDVSKAANLMNILSRNSRALNNMRGKTRVTDAVEGANKFLGFDWEANLANTAAVILQAPATVRDLWRGLLVSMPATQVRNALMSHGFIAMNVAGRAMEKGLNRLFNPNSERANMPIEALGELMRIWSPSRYKKTKSNVDEIFKQSKFIKQRDRMFYSFSSDVERKAREAGTPLYYADQFVSIVNIHSRFQEFALRRAIFETELDRILQARGTSLDAMIGSGNVRKLKVADIEAATDKALRLTFALEPEKATSFGVPPTFTAGVVDFLSSRWGAWTGLGFIVPYPKFALNFMKFLYDFSPLGVTRLLSKRERNLINSGNLEPLTDATIGSIALGAAWQVRKSKYAGDRWYDVYTDPEDKNRISRGEKIKGKIVDLRPDTPNFSYLFIAEVIRKGMDGTLDEMDSKEIMRGISGLSRTPDLKLDFLNSIKDSLVDSADAEEAKTYIKEGLGSIAADFLTPVAVVRDVLGSFDAEFAKVRDARGGFVSQVQGAMPIDIGFGSMRDLPPVESIYSDTELVREAPFLRQLTGTVLSQPKSSTQREFERLGFKESDVLPRTRSAEYDRLRISAFNWRLDEATDKLRKSKDYQSASRAMQRKILSELAEKVRRVATLEVSRMRPELAAQAQISRMSAIDRRVMMEEARKAGYSDILEDLTRGELPAQ